METVTGASTGGTRDIHQRPQRAVAVDFKILLQRREVALPKNRKLVSQIHSIKRHVLPSGKVSFDAERSTKNGHADKFWAVALACQNERQEQPRRVAEVVARVLG